MSGSIISIESVPPAQLSRDDIEWAESEAKKIDMKKTYAAVTANVSNELKEQLISAAKRNGRTLSSEMTQRLKASLQHEELGLVEIYENVMRQQAHMVFGGLDCG